MLLALKMRLSFLPGDQLKHHYNIVSVLGLHSDVEMFMRFMTYLRTFFEVLNKYILQSAKGNWASCYCDSLHDFTFREKAMLKLQGPHKNDQQRAKSVDGKNNSCAKATVNW